MMTALQLDHTATLGDLLPGCAGRYAGVPVSGLALDSRRVRRGDLFLAYPGESGDGRDFVEQAVAAGAAAVAVESGWQPARALSVPLVQCAGLRAQVSAVADRFYGHPSRDLNVVGVTGTNGKTSCTQLLGQALRLAGQSCGVIGTLGASLDGSLDGAGLTTPDPIALQRQLADWREQGVSSAALEASSHGLAQGRVDAVRFRAGVFTNLSRDHLDFHGDMAAYGAAKARLFEQPGLEFAVINADDAFGRTLAQRLRAHLPVLDYSLRPGAAVAVESADYRGDGVSAQLSTPWGRIAVRSALLGDFNLSNLLAVIAVLGQWGFSADSIERIVPQLQPIAGRMQRVAAAGAAVEVVVDYAHTPDALEHALLALRRHCAGALWCVFGCGGDRDRGKRPLMGAVAARLADRVILTSDNPRSEDPAAILAEIRAGIDGEVQIEPDRGAAIAAAIAAAAPGDIVLVAGKGHEDYQVIGAERRHFSDSEVAQQALAQRGSA